MFAWDDIAVFLALYRERTTGRAAAALGCSQPTVVRRIAALEQGLELTLFERTPTGLEPTAAAQQLFRPAEQVERSVCEFSTEVGALARTGLDVIRLTFLDHFERLLIPVLRRFRARWPGIQTELLASDRIYDMGRGEADIALRGRERPEGEELVVHQLPPSGWTVYASAHSPPEERPHDWQDVGRYPIALPEGVPSTLPIYLRLERAADGGPVPIRCSNYRALQSAIASGAAISALPCTIGDTDPDVVRCFPPAEEFDVPIYLVARRAILRRPPARDLFDSITAHFNNHPEQLMGDRG